MSRWVGVDYGDSRIGVALSDPCQIIASPLTMVKNSSPEASALEIIALAEQHEADRIIIGLPLNMNGTSGPAVEKVLAFQAFIKKHSSIRTVTWDERLSTVSAQNTLIAAGTRREKRKKLIDKIAAQIILQHYIDAQQML
ncbi:MAG: Holliday junction resolvase RuvX [Spartobacteria bacterium]|nr:Holliday junction resolvase RuvX [Spartobacteria bacterium]